MKKNFVIVVLAFSSFTAFAQDCGSLLNGEVVRLDAPGKSLEKAKVQDQDGLGTCYANTTSTVLQSAIPGNPDVSYINVALTYAEKVNSKEANSSFAYDKKGDFLMNGGHVCASIKALRESGGVCNRSEVPLEKSLFNTEAENFVDNAQVQKEIMEKVSRYYDDVNRTFSGKGSSGTSGGGKSKPKAIPGLSPETEQKITQGFRDFADKAKTFFTDLGKGFKNFFSAIFDRGNKDKPRPDDVPVIDISKKEDPIPLPSPTPSPVVTENPVIEPDPVVDNVPVQDDKTLASDSTDAFTADKFEALKSLKRPLSKKEQYQMALYELLQKRMPEYAMTNCKKLDSKNALDVVQNIAAYVFNANKDSKYDPATSALKYELFTSYMTRGEGKSKTYEFNINEKIKEAINNEYLPSFAKNPKPKNGADALVKALKKAMPKYIEEKNIADVVKKLDPDVTKLLDSDFKRYAQNDYSECSKDQAAYLRSDDGLIKDFENTPCLKAYTKLGKGIQELAIGLDNRKISDINKIADYILNSPDKNYEKSLMMLLAPTCTDESKIKIPSNLTCKEENIIFSDSDTANPTALNRKLDLEKRKLRNNISNSILNNKAVGVALCTIFFQEDVNYFYNSNKNCDVNRKDGLHAVSVIGYRCNAGKLDYLVQNSWGEWRDLNSSYERDSAFGKAWISEESMVKNTYLYSIIGP